MVCNARLLCETFIESIEELKAEKGGYAATYEMLGGRFDLFLEHMEAQEKITNMPLRPVKASHNSQDSLEIVDYPNGLSCIRKSIWMLAGYIEQHIKVNYDENSEILIPLTRDQDGHYNININISASEESVKEYYLQCTKILGATVMQKLGTNIIDVNKATIDFVFEKSHNNKSNEGYLEQSDEIFKSLTEYITVQPVIQIIGSYVSAHAFEIIDLNR